MMPTSFHIHYATAFGQQIEIVIDGVAHPMEWAEDGWWSTPVDAPPGASYHYRVSHDGEIIAVETEPHRTMQDDAPGHVVDRWRDADPARLSRESALFTRSLTARHPATVESDGDTTLRLLEPWIPEGAQVRAVGDGAPLGDWDPGAGIELSPSPYPWWEASADIGRPAEYKYVVVHGDDIVWESGPNRTIPATEGPTLVHDDEVRGLPGWRGAGIAIPVFSLRTGRGIGSGQFTDLVPLAEWAATMGVSVIQLLPVNDTVLDHDWQDSYPYNPVSVQALHPLYIDLDDIPGAGITAEVDKARSELDHLPEMDYVAVMERKWELLRRAYTNLSAALDSDDGFQSFVDREWDWLGPYSAWATLRDRHGTGDFTRWGADAAFDEKRVETMATPGGADHDDLRFHWFVQYHLQRQLTSAANHARRLGVALKGDLPIGVAPESVEVWTRPELFHIGAQTGAPPDAFAVLGQNWQFPTYDWDRMAEDGFRWWRDRFTALARYVDVYRIDHVLGFFRIWEIPPDADDGLLGHFRPSLPLSRTVVEQTLWPVDVDAMTRPAVAEDALPRLFGAHADRVRSGFFSAGERGLRLMPGVADQRRILTAFDNGILADLPDDQRTRIRRGLLDVAADVLLLEVGDGYQPRISWQDTEHYRRLTPEQRASFDEMAIDFFHHRHQQQWEEQGRLTLPAIVGATNLLTCGEDLGMVPDMVPDVMNDLGLLSLEIERMPKRLGAWTADPAGAPYLSVVSPSTHDTTTLRMWWRDDRVVAQRMWNEKLGGEGEAPVDLSGPIAEVLVRRQMASPAMLCIVPLSDLLAIDETLRRDDPDAERINDPADRHNRWRYRLHLTIGELAGADGFNDRLRSIITDNGRGG
jgi:4-alpha-glucanotransferase